MRAALANMQATALRIGQESGDIPSDQMDMREKQDRATLVWFLGLLPKPERRIVALSYGLLGEKLTDEQIGKKVGLPSDEVKQICDKSIKVLHDSAVRMREVLDDFAATRSNTGQTFH